MPKRNLRIALVTTYPPSKGSLNEYAYHFVRALRQKKEVEEIVLLTDDLPTGEAYSISNEAPTDGSHQAELKAIHCWTFGDRNNSQRIVDAVRRVKPDIVLFNIQFATFGREKVAATLGLRTPALVKQAGFPTVVLLHNIMETVDLKQAGFGSNAMVEKMMRFFGSVVTKQLLQADLVALTIPKYVEIIEGKYDAENIILAPHGSFEEVPMPSFDLPAGPRQLMAFGKFGTYKKVEILIEAAEILRGRGYDNLEVVIAGTDSPNAAGYLETVQQKYSGVSGLRFTGYVAEDDVPRIFEETAVAVFPYTSTTGSSGVLHQAGNYGKAVVLPNIGDLAEIVEEEGYSGEFFEPGNASSLADAMAKILDDDNYRREMGMANYTAACGISISDVVDWYLLHFENILPAQNSATATKTMTQASSSLTPKISV